MKDFKISEALGRNRMVGSNFRIVGKKIGAGNFGEVRIGKHIGTGEKVAIKIDKNYDYKSDKKSVDIQLKHEYDILRKIYHGYPLGHKITGIPIVYHFDKCGKVDCLVLELLGPNLEDLFELCGGKFSLKTTLMLAFQLLDRIESIHSRGIIYRDIKPENFLMGRKGSKDRNIVHLVDYGLATPYRDPNTGRHVPYRDLRTMTGTARYMSCHSHLGKSQGRRDDLESVGYTLIYFAKGRLPWQGYKANNIKEKYKKIRDAKMKYPMYILCEGLPSQFEIYMNYVKKLAFFDKPDYEFLKDIFHELYESMGFSYNDTEFDWDKFETHTDDIQRLNACGKGYVSSNNTIDDEEELDLDNEDDNNKNVTYDKSNDDLSQKQKISTHSNSKDTHNKVHSKDPTSPSEIQQNAIPESKVFVGSLSISERDTDLTIYRYQSYSEFSSLNIKSKKLTSPISPSSSSARVLNYGGNISRSCSQGYFSGDETLKTASSVAKRRVSIVVEEPKSIFSEIKPEELNNDQGSKGNHAISVINEESNVDNNEKLDSPKCAEACFTETRFSFLCFSWKRKKDGVTYHNHNACSKY
ncbi:casein kinase I-like [Lepeophtheirus salmonis]|uniref:casein kinase I-like n=1 Tax=Lepeophtheirus salmonis TaxID=72036 RepID=UPI001AE662BF|nr:casein kinase I-like [Lepeophtheirus salmonis]